MLKNYFKIAWRNLAKNKFSGFVNIGGLAIGMAVAILISFWIYDEYSYNKSFSNYDRLGKVMLKWNGRGRVGYSQPMPMGIELRNGYKDDFSHVVMSSQTEDHVLAAGENKFRESGKYIQAEAPEMFSLEMLAGSRKGLAGMNSIMISRSLAKKLFRDGNGMNQLVRMDNKDNVMVTGIFEDFPSNNEFKEVNFFAPWDLYTSTNEWMKGRETQWRNNFLHIYVQLAPKTDFEKVSAKIKDIKLSHVDAEEAAAKPAIFIHPMSRWHLYSQFGEGGVNITSDQIKFIRFYATIGFFVLLLACINFMNLSTARSEKRAKEVGIRKAIGSLRSHLIGQFFSEALIVSFAAFAFSILLVFLVIPWFNEISNKKMAIPFSEPLFWLLGLSFTVMTGLMAGSYPALYLSSFNAVRVLKGTFRAGRIATIPRKVLVIVQFTVSVSLMIGTTIVYRQIEFARNRPVGYDRNGLIMIPIANNDFRGKYDLIKSRLMNSGVVSETAESMAPPTGIWSENDGFEWKGKDPGLKQNFATLPVSQEYGKTVGWQFVSGRDFSKDIATDSGGFVINESAVKIMNLKIPVGETIYVKNIWFQKGENFKVLGVVKDMVMNSPYEPSSPTIFFLKPEADLNWIMIKVNPAVGTSFAISKIEAVFRALIPSAPFEFKFVDQEYAAKFADEERVGVLAGIFAGLAIFISCLGLFGLASFMAEQRTKEIGVRKVVGASMFAIWKLLSKDFVMLVMISSLIAIPIASYFMNEWLQKYEYRTQISWWVYTAAIVGALMITLTTISYQAIKTALKNPVESLRSE
ncbi:MAG: ABC transporter permease [Chitinophagales bacterium]